jgi:hypothetical protein
VSYAPPRNGLVAGSIVLLAGAALTAGGTLLIVPCAAQQPSCNTEVQTAFAIPMAALGVAGVALGITMMAWHQPAQSDVVVEPDWSEEGSVSSRRHDAHRAAGAVVAAVPIVGGAAGLFGTWF